MAALLVALVLGLASTAVGTPAADPSSSASQREIRYAPDRFGPYEALGAILSRHAIRLSDGRLPGVRIVIHKSDYRLELWSGDLVLKAYKIQLGPEPYGPKTAMGDKRTPEGIYRICAHNPQSRYYRSLQINYPGEADIQRGLDAGTITAGQAAELRAALVGCGCPSGTTPLGGSIFLHGQHPTRTDAVRAENAGRTPRPGLEVGDVDPATQETAMNWTLGCVAMSNADIRELYRFVPDGTVVEILP
jgi:murein L,D-transpeptidase YafK